MLSTTNLWINRYVSLVAGVIALLLSAYVIGSMAASEEYGYLSIGIVIGLFGAFLVLKNPLVGLALMFFLVPLGPVTRFIGGERTITFALAAFLIGLYGARVLILHEKIKLDQVSKLAIAFIGWGGITCLWAYNPEVSLRYILRLIQLVAIYVLIINYCRSQRHWDIITLSFAAGAVISATATILLGSTYKGLATDSARATLSEEFNPNYLSSMLGTGIILIFYHLYKTKYNWLKVLLLLGTIPLIYAIIRAQSRGVWIGLPAALLVSFILTTRNLQLIKKIVVVITVLIGIIASAYYAGVIDQSVMKRYKTISSRGTAIATEGRADIWKVGLEMIKDTFPLGVGFKNYKAVFHKYAPGTNVYMEAYKVQKGRDPHNTFLGVLVETGLVGFILFMGIFVHLFKRIWRIEDLFIRLVQMWLFTFLILISLKGTINFTPWFWIILAYISLVTSVDRQKNHQVLSR